MRALNRHVIGEFIRRAGNSSGDGGRRRGIDDWRVSLSGRLRHQPYVEREQHFRTVSNAALSSA
jgi:hypothetical protein